MTSDQVISTRERGELRWRIYKGLTHASQYYATTSSSTAEVVTLRLHHSLLASLLLPACCGSPMGDRIPCYMGPESGHRSPFHRYFSKYLSTSRASRLLVETPSYPKGKNILVVLLFKRAGRRHVCYCLTSKTKEHRDAQC